jgi:hypothetical protein
MRINGGAHLRHGGRLASISRASRGALRGVLSAKFFDLRMLVVAGNSLSLFHPIQLTQVAVAVGLVKHMASCSMSFILIVWDTCQEPSGQDPWSVQGRGGASRRSQT